MRLRHTFELGVCRGVKVAYDGTRMKGGFDEKATCLQTEATSLFTCQTSLFTHLCLKLCIGVKLREKSRLIIFNWTEVVHFFTF